ncbi:YeeE/YedE family protein [Thalassotalea sp. 1_MG-2023]|uniref:YeeE/YedE family protein n=1 Tax=Thalassotalea sp. 1_MG-2023 TaxID=3062680 RepID=UPI0026E1EEF0|nr:YeeE/YedE family protein [Thalassotalea sp. 1_MG-2023]MDO6428176.1 YeeE/YedE family protein [Thalassotalea sp. 1_MG-2023]
MESLISYLPAFLGGMLIGLSALLLFIGLGRIAGISGIVGKILQPLESDNQANEKLWRVLFILGLVVGAAIYHFFDPFTLPFRQPPSAWFMIISGLLVGIGTYIGSGCTSGHGVCGIGRFSIRSLSATIIFMLTAGITVFVIKHVLA